MNTPEIEKAYLLRLLSGGHAIFISKEMVRCVFEEQYKLASWCWANNIDCIEIGEDATATSFAPYIELRRADLWAVTGTSDESRSASGA